MKAMLFNQNFPIMYSKPNFSSRSIGGMIEDMFQNGLSRVWSDEAAERLESAPVNIQETEKSYELQVVAPGLKKDEFKVGIDRNVLTISYDHKEQEAEKTSRWLRSEYKMRSFKRSFTLNDKIDAGSIAARYADGILYVSLPKKDPADTTPQEISVS